MVKLLPLLLFLFLQAIWYSSGGTKSLFSVSHRDEIVCVIRGRNEYLMVPHMKYKDRVRITSVVNFQACSLKILFPQSNLLLLKVICNHRLGLLEVQIYSKNIS